MRYARPDAGVKLLTPDLMNEVLVALDMATRAEVTECIVHLAEIADDLSNPTGLRGEARRLGRMLNKMRKESGW